jgi:alpha-1,6-mannosyltransferase
LKVLDITKFFGPTTGGIRTYLLEKEKFVQHRDDLHQVVVVPAKTRTVREAGRTRWYFLPGHPIPTQAPYRFLGSRRAVAEVIEAERPDIIEVGSPYLVPWITRKASAALGIPLVWFYHTNFPRIISPRPREDGLLRRSIGRLAERYVHRLASLFDAAIGASQVAVDSLRKAGFRRVERVPLGVSLSTFHPGRREYAARTRRLAGLPEGPLAIFTGRLAREKELNLIIDAWPDVERATGASLVLVGDGPSRGYFQKRCQAKHVIWLPHEPDRERLADLLAAADLYLAPGPAETFGLAALEAMASGLPVVASDQGAVRELVEASGAGMVNPVPTAAAMSNTIATVLRQDLPQLGIRGRSYAEANHSWDMAFNRLFDFYRTVIAERRA